MKCLAPMYGAKDMPKKPSILVGLVSLFGLLASALPPGVDAVGPRQDVQIVAQDGSGLTIELNLPAYQVQPVQRAGVTYQEIHLAGEGWSWTGQPGAPQAPERSLLLAAPPTGDVALQVEGSPQLLPGRYVLPPAPEVASPRGSGPPAEPLRWQADPAQYAQDAWLPAAQAEISGEGWLRGQRFVRLALRPFQVNPATGQVRAVERLQVRLQFSQPATVASPSPADPLFDPLLRAAFLNYGQAAGWRIRPQPQPVRASPAQRMASSGSWVKLAADADGLYRVAYQDLLDAGVAATTLDAMSPATLRLLDDGLEQAIHVVDGGDGAFDPDDFLLFYGQRHTDYLSDDRNIYWLTWGGANGQRMALQNGAPTSAPLPNTVLTSVRLERNNLFNPSRPFATWMQPVDHDHWFWANVLRNTSHTITIEDVKLNTASTVRPTLEMFAVGGNWEAANYKVFVKVNGDQAAGGLTWWGSAGTLTSMTLGAYPYAASLDYGANTLTLIPQYVPGNNDDSIWLDWLRLTYPWNGEYLPDAPFSNPDPGAWTYQVSKAPSSAAWILNLSNPAQPKLVTNAFIHNTGAGLYQAIWTLTTSASDRFLFTPEAQVRQPFAVELYDNTGLLDANQQTDYLVVAHRDFIPAVQPLVDARAAQGLSVRIVDVQDIYDDFNDGSLSAEAIRDYLAYAYTSYQWPPPAYVLLVGDGATDFRGYQFAQYGHANYIPPFVGAFDFWSGTTVADTAFALLQGDDVLAEMMIGRLPANSLAEAQVMVDKIVNYQPPVSNGDWTRQTLWVADNDDLQGNDFPASIDQIITRVLPDFNLNRIYYCNPAENGTCGSQPWIYTDPLAARQAIVDAVSAGQLLVNYSGHGGIGVWAQEWLFGNNQVPELANADKLAFTVVIACEVGDFSHYRYNGLEESLVRHPGGGTVGGFASTTSGLLAGQQALVEQFYAALMGDRVTQAGMTAALAKIRTYTDANIAADLADYTVVGHSLTGDPALRLLEPNDDCAAGDGDCDGNIDIVDLQRAIAAWSGAFAGLPGYNGRFDMDGDGSVDIDDVIIIAGQWQASASSFLGALPQLE